MKPITTALPAGAPAAAHVWRIVPPVLRSLLLPAVRAIGFLIVLAVAVTALLGALPAALAAQAEADLVLNLTDSPDPVMAMGRVTYHMQVTNDGTAAAAGVKLTVDVPTDVRFDGYVGGGGGASCSGMAVGAVGPGTLVCTLPDLAPDATHGVDVWLVPTQSGMVTVSARVETTSPESSLGDNEREESTTVTVGADLGLIVTAPSSVVAGQGYDYTISVTNAGPSPASAVRVRFPVPAGFAPSGALPAGCVNASNVITCQPSGSIAAGGTLLIGTISGQAAVASGSTVSGSATVSVREDAPPGTPQDPNAANNTVNVTTSVTAGSDLRIAVGRSPSSGSYFVDGTLNLVLTPSFTGDSPTGLTIVDVVPAQYAINTGSFSASQGGWSCSVAGQTVTCTRATAPAAGSNVSLGTINIPVTVVATGTATNSATISATAPADPNMGNNTASDGGALLQDPVADLAISKSGPSPALVVTGQSFDYQLRVTNRGPSAFFGDLVVTDHLPAGLTFEGSAGTGWSCTPAAPVTGAADIECRRGYTSASRLASGAQAPVLTIHVTATADGTIVNRATLTTESANVPDPELSNNSTSSGVGSSQPAASADVGITKGVDLATVPAGEVLTYTLEVSNAGPVAAMNVLVSDTLTGLVNASRGATGAGFISAAVTPGAATTGTITCSDAAYGGDGRRVSCTIPELPVCTVGVDCPTIQLAVRPGGDGGVRSNTGHTRSQATADHDLSNNAASVTSTVEPRADVSVSLSGLPATVPAGQALVYTITARDNGPSRAENVVVTQQLPLGVVFTSANPAVGSCSVTPAAGSLTTAANRTVQCELGTINNGAQRTVQVTVRPPSPVRGTTLTSTAAVSTTSTEPAVPGASNNSASFDVQVGAPALDLVLNQRDLVDPITVGDNTTYRVTVRNIGPSDAQDVVISSPALAPGLSFQSHSISAGSCATLPAVDQVGGPVSCTVGRLFAGDSIVLQLEMKGVTKGVHENPVSVSSYETVYGFEVRTDNNEARERTTVRTRTELELASKVPSVSDIAVRRPFTWTINLQNVAGAGRAEGDSVRVTDNLPAGMVLTGPPVASVVTGTTSLNSCTGAAGEGSFTCSLGTVDAGTEVNIVVPVMMTSVPAGGSVTNTAQVLTSSYDIEPTNNTVSGTLGVHGSSITGAIFRDFAADGARDATDTGIGGIQVTLTGTAFDGASVTRTATTDASGVFSFTGLPEGTYGVQRGAVTERLLNVGVQVAGSAGGDVSATGTITSISLGEQVDASGYLFTFVPQARVGLAEREVTNTPHANGSFSSQLRVRVRNYSLETLTNVVLTDVVAGAVPALGSHVAGGASASLPPGSYTIQVAPAFVGACTGGTTNPAFDGSGATELARIVSLAAGAQCDVQFTVRFMPVDPLPAGGFQNQASGTANGQLSGQAPADLSHNSGSMNADPDSDGDPTNNNVPTPIGAMLRADVTTTVTLPASADAGSQVTGVVRYGNLGPYVAAGVSYTMRLPAGLAGVSFGNLPPGANASYDPASGNVILTGMPSSLDAAQVASGDGTTGISVTYTQPGSGTSTLQGAITTVTPEIPAGAPNSASASVSGALIADVSAAMSFPASVNAGQVVSGTVTFQNVGPSAASGVTYTLQLSPGLTGVTLGNLPAGATAAYNAATGVVTLSGMPATIAAGAIASGNGTSGIAVSYVQNGVANSSVQAAIATTTSEGANALPNDDAATVTGGLVADVGTAISLPLSVNAGGTVSGTVAFRNHGPSIASGVTYSLELTPGLGGVAIGNLPAGASAAYDGVTGVVTLTGMPATLASGQLASGDGSTGITLSYIQPPSAVSTVTSEIGTTADQGANVQLDHATVSPGGVPVADVRTVVAAPATVDAGQEVVAEVSYGNTGPSPAQGVGYALTLSPGLTGVSFGNLPTGASATYDGVTGVVTLTGMPATLAAGEVASADGTAGISVRYVQPPAASSTVQGSISTTTSQGANIAPDAGSANVGGSLIADVTTQLAFPPSVDAGQVVSGTVTFRNAGPSTASGLTYTITLSPGLGTVTVGNLPAGASASYDNFTGAVTLTGMPPTLAAGAIASNDGATGITVSYTQPGTALSLVSGTIGTTTNQGTNTLADAASTTLGGELVADVTSELALPPSVDAGQPVNGSVIFRNTGPSIASGLTYTLTLPPGLSGATFGNLPGGATASYDSGTGQVTFTGMPGSLPPGTIASQDGATGITVEYEQPGSGTSTVVSRVSTTTGQGADVAPDEATATVTGGLVADVMTTVTLPPSADAGSEVEAIVVYRNHGPSAASGMGYTLTLPAGLAGVDVTNLPVGATYAYDAVTGVVTLTGMPSALAAGAVASGNDVDGILVTYRQPGPATSTVSSAVSTTTSQGANVLSDVASATVAGAFVADVTTSLTFPVDVTAGLEVSGTVTFRNDGPSDAAGVGYTLTLSRGLGTVDFGNLPPGATATYDGATGVVTLTGMPATLVAGRVASGDGGTGITVRYTQPPVAGGTSVASTISTTTNQGTNAAPDAAAAAVATSVADLEVRISTDTTSVRTGDLVTYRVRVTNNGPTPLPAGSLLALEPTGAVAESVACAVAGGNLCTTPAAIGELVGGGATLPAIAVGESYELVLEARVTATSGALSVRARVQVPAGFVDTRPANDVDVAGPLPVRTGPDLGISKTAVGAMVPGGSATYRITVRNGGTGPTTGPVTVTDGLPAMLEFVGVEGDGWSCGVTNRTLSCAHAAPIAVSDSASFMLTTRLAPDASGLLVNVADVSAADDGPLGEKSARSEVMLGGAPDLALTKSAGTDTLKVGGTVTYSLLVSNGGGAATSDTITVTDLLPAGLVPVTAAGEGFTCSIDAQAVSCVRADAPLPAGQTVAVTITAEVTGSVARAPVTNQACVRTAGDLNRENDCGSVTTLVEPRGELRLRKEATGPFVSGQQGTFRLVVQNLGGTPAPGPITVTDTLPRGLEFAAATGSGWSCSAAAGVVDCALAGEIAAGDSAVVTLTTRIGNDVAGEVTNCAVLGATSAAVAVGGARSCATVAVGAELALVLEITTPRYEREVGDVPDFTIVVRNPGSTPIPDVVVTAELPRGFGYVAGSSTRGGGQRPQRIGDPDAAGSTLAWSIGTLAPGEVVRIGYRAEIGTGARFDGDNVTDAVAMSAGVVSSNRDDAPVRLRAGVFGDRGVIVGKLYLRSDSARTGGQEEGDVGIPGVRMLMEDGTGAITDIEGKFSFANVRAGLHVVKVDRTTLPAGARLLVTDTRNAGDAYSRFVDLKGGELHRADFVESSGADSVLRAVMVRRSNTGLVPHDSTGSPILVPGGTVVGLAGGTAGEVREVPRSGVPAMAGTDTQPAAVAGGVGGTHYVPLMQEGLGTNVNVAPNQLGPVRRLEPLATAPARAGRGTIELVVPDSGLPADGRTLVPVTVRVRDAAGKPVRGPVPVRLEASVGGWLVNDGTPHPDGLEPGANVVVTDGEGVFPLLSSLEPAAGELRASTADVSTTRLITFLPASRPLVAVGVLQGRVDLRSLGRGQLDLTAGGDGFEETLQDLRFTRDSGRVAGSARGAVFLKGEVKGAGLVTLGYDSERDRDATQFRDITPESGFPVLGDASLREFDARTRERLYFRLDRGASSLRYGDFVTQRQGDQRMLLAYDRSLTGVSAQVEGARGVLATFVSQGDLRQLLDEIPGRGLSGPYFLSRGSVVGNSERVELVTRDRNQPAVVLATEKLVRFSDYILEPGTGRIVFRRPVPSLDENLNPVSLRVSYEVEQGGPSFLTYGGDGRVRLGSRLELGGLVARDENPLDRQLVLGGSATAKLGAGTYLLGEVAHTETGEADLAGDAWRFELLHRSAAFEGRVYAIRADSAYLNRSATFTGGRAEYGARWSARVGERTRVVAEALRTEDVRTDGRRDGASVAVEHRLTEGVIAELGYRWADETATPASPLTRGVTPISTQSARARVTTRVPGSDRSTAFAEYEHAVDGSDARRAMVGGDYRLADWARLYARHEWISSLAGPYALNEGQDQQNTVIGVDADYLRNGQAFSEYRARDAFNGRDAEASIGLRNRWPIARGVLGSTSFERVSPLAGEGTGEAFALTGALEWTRSRSWKGTARMEWRNGPAGDDFLGSLGYARKLSTDWTLLGRTLWDQQGDAALRGRSQVGLAWRQVGVNDVNALFRFENILDQADALGEPTSRSVSNVAAALVNVQPTPGLVLSGRYAAKLATDRRGDVSTNSTAHLLMGRVRKDLTSRLDAGLIGSVLGDGRLVDRRYGVGGELGLVIFRNARVAGGYNLFGYTDRDFAQLGYTQRGAYFEFGFKFDETLLQREGQDREEER